MLDEYTHTLQHPTYTQLILTLVPFWHCPWTRDGKLSPAPCDGLPGSLPPCHAFHSHTAKQMWLCGEIVWSLKLLLPPRAFLSLCTHCQILLHAHCMTLFHLFWAAQGAGVLWVHSLQLGCTAVVFGTEKPLVCWILQRHQAGSPSSSSLWSPLLGRPHMALECRPKPRYCTGATRLCLHTIALRRPWAGPLTQVLAIAFDWTLLTPVYWAL